MDKTNVMRILEQHGVNYRAFEYPHGKDAVDGETVALALGQDPRTVFKTLVARGRSGALAVFVIPVAAELDLKKAARAANEKSVELIAVKQLLPLTGYVRGGCSPIGMKKALLTVFDQSALALDTVMVSAGRIGFQVACAPADLIRLTGGRAAALTAP